MLANWLKWNLRNPNPYLRFQVIDVSEHGDKDNAVKSHLKKIFLDSTVDLSFVANLTKRIGWSKAEVFIANSVPSSPRMRKGRFGEVLTAALLLEFFKYVIPVQKSQYAMTANQSLPSTDVVAIKKTNKGISEVCFLESKLRTKPDTGVVVEAYKQLRNDQSKRIPDMLMFIIHRLYDTGDPLYHDFLNYLKDRDDTSVNRETLRVGIVCEQESWKDLALDNLQDEIDDSTPQRITTDIIRITCLENFMREFFNHLESGRS